MNNDMVHVTSRSGISRWTRTINLCVLLIALIVMCPRIVRGFEQVGPPANEYPYFDERLSISAGVIHPFANTQIQYDSDNGLPGTFFDFENDLGFEGDSTRAFIHANYRVGKHASFVLTYLDISRSSTKTLAKEIEFGNRTFSTNATVNAFLNTQSYLLTYQYSFVRNIQNEFGASFGINFVNISAGLSSAGSFSGAVLSTATAGGKDVSFLVPIPLVGLHFSSQFLPKTFMRNSIQYLDINAEGTSIRSLNYLIAVDYNPWPSIGIGAGVYANKMEINTGTGFSGKFLYNITGTQVYIRYYI